MIYSLKQVDSCLMWTMHTFKINNIKINKKSLKKLKIRRNRWRHPVCTMSREQKIRSFEINWKERVGKHQNQLPSHNTARQTWVWESQASSTLHSSKYSGRHSSNLGKQRIGRVKWKQESWVGNRPQSTLAAVQIRPLGAREVMSLDLSANHGLMAWFIWVTEKKQRCVRHRRNSHRLIPLRDLWETKVSSFGLKYLYTTHCWPDWPIWDTERK